MSIKRLLEVLVRLDKLLNSYGIEYIVIGSLADYLLGVPGVEPGDIDILVGEGNVEKLNAMIQSEKDIDISESIKWREWSIMKGLYGKILLDSVPVDIMAKLQVKYGYKWLSFTYEKLLPCTLEVDIDYLATVRIPCPEIQVIADKAMGRHNRARAIVNIVSRKKCGCNNRILFPNDLETSEV